MEARVPVYEIHKWYNPESLMVDKAMSIGIKCEYTGPILGGKWVPVSPCVTYYDYSTMEYVIINTQSPTSDNTNGDVK